MNRIFASLVLVCAMCLVAPLAEAGVTIAWSPVGNPGNTADTTGFGAVSYAYNIGTYDVTNSQYVAFLNSIDATASSISFTKFWNDAPLPSSCRALVRLASDCA